MAEISNKNIYNPTFLDDDGYPTDELLEYIGNYKNFESVDEILELIEKVWWMPDWGIIRKKPYTEKHTGSRKFTYYISTGGWSGNESLIRALKNNFMFWNGWRVSKAGGHYMFRFNVTNNYKSK